jgi:hypothetical protein
MTVLNKHYSWRDNNDIINTADYEVVTSQNATGDPLEIEYYRGGVFDPATGSYTGGVKIATRYFRYDVDGNFNSSAIL